MIHCNSRRRYFSFLQHVTAIIDPVQMKVKIKAYVNDNVIRHRVTVIRYCCIILRMLECLVPSLHKSFGFHFRWHFQGIKQLLCGSCKIKVKLFIFSRRNQMLALMPFLRRRLVFDTGFHFIIGFATLFNSGDFSKAMLDSHLFQRTTQGLAQNKIIGMLPQAGFVIIKQLLRFGCPIQIFPRFGVTLQELQIK